MTTTPHPVILKGAQTRDRLDEMYYSEGKVFPQHQRTERYIMGGKVVCCDADNHAFLHGESKGNWSGD